MHRDLKPDNIFLGEGLTVKIGDYGMSKKSEIGLHNTSQVGTPLYSSPEILQGRGEYTSKTDIFSAALIIYYMLFGNPMFREAMSIDHLKELQQRYLRPDAKEKKLATFKCSDFFRGLMGFMLELEESKRPTIFEAVEWYTKHSGVDLSCSFKKVSSKKDQ
jgi:serine/threonine protein kinase